MAQELFKYNLISLIILLSFTFSFAKTLQFNDKGEFTILQLTDMHYAGNDTLDLWTQQLQRNLIKWVKPDFIVVSGDAVTGAIAKKLGGYKKYWKMWTDPIVEARIPYAYIFGNHDCEGDLDCMQIVSFDSKNPYSVRTDCEGIPLTTNFIVPVYSSRSQDELAANIWMFDSGSEVCDGFVHSWGCVERYQLEWYDQESKKIKEQHGDDLHQFAFVHIPIPEFRDLYNNYKIDGIADDWVGCPFVDPGFFDHVKANKDIAAMYVGHDHKNEFAGWYDGIELVYGRKSGYNAYGDVRGARVIKLKEGFDEKGDLKVTRSSYIVTETGFIVQPKAPKPRDGESLDHCSFPGALSTWRNRIDKFFWSLGHYIEKILR